MVGSQNWSVKLMGIKSMACSWGVCNSVSHINQCDDKNVKRKDAKQFYEYKPSMIHYGLSFK